MTTPKFNKNKIVIRGAREHNLKNIDLEIPRDKFIVMTGLSGSGKSSLAFDTIYADGQRRYIESLSSYARMFLGQAEKPDVDSIEGLSPAISIDQKTTSKNPRSTVGTVTEIYDYLRLLYARIGIPHCPDCGREIKKQTIDQIADRITALPPGTKLQILAPVVRRRKGQFVKEFAEYRRHGYARVRVDGNIYDLSEKIPLDKNKNHDVEIVIDRLVIKEGINSRLCESCESAGAVSGGLVFAEILKGGGESEILQFSQNYACPEHGASIEELEPRMFSFNNPLGACAKCGGIGIMSKVDPDLVIPNKNLSVAEGAVHGSGWSYAEGSIAAMYFEGLAKHYGFSLRVPVSKLPETALKVLLYGTDGEKITVHRSIGGGRASRYETEFEGVINNLERRYVETQSSWSKDDIHSYMYEAVCPVCKGERLNDTILSVTVADLNISNFCKMSVDESLEFIAKMESEIPPETSERFIKIGETILKEIKGRLGFLKSVGLGYLTLSRASGTLSGGESQRIRLATQIGSSLTGVLYVLDEPSIGLHQRDNDKLITTLKHLRDLGNTLIVVEHDEDTMRAADFIVDIGPGAGSNGGEIIAVGTVKDIEACERSLTGQYLSGKMKIPVPENRREPDGRTLTVRGAAANNLKKIDVSVPLGLLTCITGVSGSGKSSLVNEIMYKYLAKKLNRARTFPGAFAAIEGAEELDKVINIDQSPIGRTPRSNPATYTGLFTDVRDLYASVNEAKVKGFAAGRFSFNVKGGRCEACEGDGIIKIEMNFLPDVYVPCEVCGGKRYNRETLEIKYKGRNIYEVLEMTVDEGIEFFASIPKIARRLETLRDVGLSYVKIGQPATTLSGGEAQRVKLASELSKRPTGRTIYILDEPTTGLHTADVHKLAEVLLKLTAGGNTVVVIEHNLDMIKTADYVIDLGPEGGGGGGTVVAAGTPEEVAKCRKSYTGKYLKRLGM